METFFFKFIRTSALQALSTQYGNAGRLAIQVLDAVRTVEDE